MNRNLLLAAAFALTFSFAAASPAQVVVRIGPPPRRPVEVAPARPVEHPGYVWTPGYHRYEGGHYVWVPGRYVEPPRPRARWVPGHWSARRGGYVWVEGHWR